MLEIIDRALNWLVRHNLNNWPTPVHPLMATRQPSVYADEGYEDWLPIASTVTDKQLTGLELAIGYQLPPAYRAFLQHKHFYELLLGQADFFPHPVKEWSEILRKEMLLNWSPDAQQAGLIPFASWGGAGDVLCFTASGQQAKADYPVLLWNHEDGNTEFFSTSFATLLPKLLAEIPERDM